MGSFRVHYEKLGSFRVYRLFVLCVSVRTAFPLSLGECDTNSAGEGLRPQSVPTLAGGRECNNPPPLAQNLLFCLQLSNKKVL